MGTLIALIFVLSIYGAFFGKGFFRTGRRITGGIIVLAFILAFFFFRLITRIIGILIIFAIIRALTRRRW